MSDKPKYPIRKPAGWKHGEPGVYINGRSLFSVRCMCAYCGRVFAGWEPHYSGSPCVESASAKTATQRV